MTLLALVLQMVLQVGTTPSRADSAKVHAGARASQARFERQRRDLLPWTYVGSPDHCDERIGRLCFWFDDRADQEPPPPEPPAIAAFRDTLLAALAEAARQLPGDAWIAGQRVRYLLEAGRPAEAGAAAQECRPREHWWCAALAGFALHGGEHYAAAESAYAAALAAMPGEERCRWSDITVLLDGPARGRYHRLGCGERDSLERRFWWLADPLYLTPGNERYTEHLSRHVWDRLQRDALATEGIVWGGDLREILLRYGWPSAWARDRYSTGSFGTAAPAIVAHYPRQARAFDPPAELFDRPERISEERWTLNPGRPRASYAPSYAAAFDSLRYQLAVFRRRDSAVVVGAYDLSGDSLPRDGPALAGLVLYREPLQEPLALRSHQQAAGVIALTTPLHPGLVSLEVLAPAHRRAGRARQWLDLTPLPAADVAVSDVLLLSRADSLPRSLEAAIPLARPSMAAAPGDTVGVYWEIYGLGPGSRAYAVSLTLVKENGSWLRRAARAIGLAAAERPQVSLGWDDVSPPGSEPAAGSLALDLAGNGPGRYTLRLTATPLGGRPAVAERTLWIQ